MSSVQLSLLVPQRLLLSLLSLLLLIICALSDDASTIPTQNMSHKERAELR